MAGRTRNLLLLGATALVLAGCSAGLREFVEANDGFVVEEPTFAFNEGAVTERVTYWPGGFIRRLR